jgi:phosphoenolpyruvate carboxykinase (ATP)
MPKNIFFLTADAFGVLPPISKLNSKEVMFHFISGYTAKVAGTEDGIVEPEATFSACFGEPFMPLHPKKYAQMLVQKIEKFNVNVWLINTGWTGGPYGTGKRISLKYTRSMVNAVLNETLNNVEYEKHEIFGLNMPKECPYVPSGILNPSKTWLDKSLYIKQAKKLDHLFKQNFKKFSTEKIKQNF